MRAKYKIMVVAAGIIAVVVVGLVRAQINSGKNHNEIVREITPVMGNIENTISTTGSVLPRNRLEVKPPVSGRVEQVLVQEGERVKAGQTLAMMSSTERAALLDAARAQGEEALKYWQEVYKAISLISPIDGEVIVATTQPGQTVTTSDAVVVLSDQLIVRAQVDETDIGKVKVGEDAIVTLDAYSDVAINAKVEHIYYESVTVNNVTTYNVDLILDKIPDFFRSGMNATVNFVVENKENILLIPSDAVVSGKDGRTFVFVKTADPKGSERRPVNLGISDDKNVEIVSGLDLKDTVVVKSTKYSLPQSTSAGTNPFMPSRRPGAGGRQQR